MTEPIESDVPVKEIPEIEKEEDIPFPAQKAFQDPDSPVDKKLNKTDDLSREITRFRYRTGGRVLYIAMAAMGVAVVIDLIALCFGKQSELVINAFEAFKLITMTVLGYIFGSDNSKS